MYRIKNLHTLSISDEAPTHDIMVKQQKLEDKNVKLMCRSEDTEKFKAQVDNLQTSKITFAMDNADEGATLAIPRFVSSEAQTLGVVTTTGEVVRVANGSNSNVLSPKNMDVPSTMVMHRNMVNYNGTMFENNPENNGININSYLPGPSKSTQLPNGEKLKICKLISTTIDNNTYYIPSYQSEVTDIAGPKTVEVGFVQSVVQIVKSSSFQLPDPDKFIDSILDLRIPRPFSYTNINVKICAIDENKDRYVKVKVMIPANAPPRGWCVKMSTVPSDSDILQGPSIIKSNEQKEYWVKVDKGKDMSSPLGFSDMAVDSKENYEFKVCGLDKDFIHGDNAGLYEWASKSSACGVYDCVAVNSHAVVTEEERPNIGIYSSCMNFSAGRQEICLYPFASRFHKGSSYCYLNLRSVATNLTFKGSGSVGVNLLWSKNNENEMIPEYALSDSTAIDSSSVTWKSLTNGTTKQENIGYSSGALVISTRYILIRVKPGEGQSRYLPELQPLEIGGQLEVSLIDPAATAYHEIAKHKATTTVRLCRSLWRYDRWVPNVPGKFKERLFFGEDDDWFLPEDRPHLRKSFDDKILEYPRITEIDFDPTKIGDKWTFDYGSIVNVPTRLGDFENNLGFIDSIDWTNFDQTQIDWSLYDQSLFDWSKMPDEYRGQDGAPGSQGPAGPGGVNGLSAYELWLNDGNMGKSIADWIASITGGMGPPGPQGPSGGTGPQGPGGGTGPGGQNGLSAYELWLLDGNVGEFGDWMEFLRGNTGPQGPQGPGGGTGPGGLSAYELWLQDGNVGEFGDWIEFLKGIPGPRGFDGVGGADGPIGPGGLSAYELALQEGEFAGTVTEWFLHIKGPNGPEGPQGPIGASGGTGPQGPGGTNGLSAYELWLQSGNTGDIGDWFSDIKGDTGPQGPIGTTGAVGLQGVSGSVGAPGPQGPGGGTGPQGPSGTNGLSAYELWQDAGNTGDIGDWFSDIKGDTGPQGPIGTTGAVGLQGVSGSVGAPGPQGPGGGTGPQGPSGTNGLSAYELWLQNGKTGDIGDWLNDIKGDTGPQGLIGATGPTGPTGDQGLPGLTPDLSGIESRIINLEIGRNGDGLNEIIP